MSSYGDVIPLQDLLPMHPTAVSLTTTRYRVYMYSRDDVYVVAVRICFLFAHNGHCRGAIMRI